MSDSVRPQRRQPTRLPRPWASPDKNTGMGCHFLLQCMKVKSESEVVQWCPTLCDPMDCSPPSSSIHGIFQARVLEWGAIAFSVEYYSAVKKEWNHTTYRKMDGPRDYHTNWRVWNRKTNTIWCYLYIGSKIWCKWTYKDGKWGHGQHKQRDKGVRMQQEGGDLQTKKRRLRRNQPCRHVISNF